jgi:hypothetical protein
MCLKCQYILPLYTRRRIYEEEDACVSNASTYCLCIRGGGYMRRKIHVSQMPVHTAFVYEEEDI